MGLYSEKSRIGGGEIGGFGMLAIRERISHMVGRLEIDGFPGNGSRFTPTVSIVAPTHCPQT